MISFLFRNIRAQTGLIFFAGLLSLVLITFLVSLGINETIQADNGRLPAFGMIARVGAAMGRVPIFPLFFIAPRSATWILDLATPAFAYRLVSSLVQPASEQGGRRLAGSHPGQKFFLDFFVKSMRSKTLQEVNLW